MFNWKGTKRTALMVGAVALAILIGTGVVAAAQNQAGPFASGAGTTSHSQSSVRGDSTAESTAEPTDEPTDQPEAGQGDQENDQEFVGTIQSIDQTGQTFVLAPDDGSAAVTIAFDSHTDIENEDGGSGNTPLVEGAHVRVEVVKRADGSLYAKEIKPASGSNGDGQGSGDGGSGDGGSGDGSGGGH